ncbi:MAG: hypothetical protein WAM60_14035 [Candidatus Promineifilaceae bacterium]
MNIKKLDYRCLAPVKTVAWFCLIPLVILLTGLACGPINTDKDYNENFNQPGSWGIGDRSDIEGTIENGVYEMLVKSNYGIYYATAGEDFSDGIYEVKATQVDGPLNNGYGLLFRVNEETDSFYAFEVSGDGYVWIGRCSSLCDEDNVTLVGGDWFRSPAVQTGLQATNHLQVIADGNRMTFLVNSVEVGRTSDTTFVSGDIAIVVETLGERGVRVVFDDFKVSPLNN